MGGCLWAFFQVLPTVLVARELFHVDVGQNGQNGGVHDNGGVSMGGGDHLYNQPGKEIRFPPLDLDDVRLLLRQLEHQAERRAGAVFALYAAAYLMKQAFASE